MIYSYIDTLLEKWVEWSDGFLSAPLISTTNDLNTILGTAGSDNPTRANEFFNIGFLNFKLTGSSIAFDNLRESRSIHSSLGYIAYLMQRKRQKNLKNKLHQAPVTLNGRAGGAYLRFYSQFSVHKLANFPISKCVRSSHFLLHFKE